MLLAIGGAAAATALMASAYTFKEYKSARPERLYVPATPDSIMKENPFKTEDLLASRGELPGNDATGWTTVLADTTGQIMIDGFDDEDRPALHSFTTRLRAPRFTKGKLVLRSTSRAAVKINGETKITKTTADSLPKESETPLELAPEADYDITVDLLGMPGESTPSFSLEFTPDDDYKDIEVSASPALGRRVSPLTTMTGERVSGVSLSDDGKYLITTSREVISAKETVWRATLSETASGRVISEDINSRARWLPGRNAYYFTSARAGVHDVYRTDVPSMKTTLMAKGIPDADVTFSPDCRYMFYYKNVEADKESGPMHRYRDPDDRIPGDRDRSYIMRYDLQSHVSVPLTYGGQTTGIYSFTPDGSKMLYGVTQQTPDRYPFYNTTLVQMDLNTMKCDTVVRKLESTLTCATYSPDGRELFIVAGPSAFGGIGANYAPHEIGNDFDGQGYILDIADGKTRAMTRDFDPALMADATWNPADGKIYFTAEDGFLKRLYRLDPKSGSINALDTEVQTVRSFSIGDKEATWLAYYGGSFTRDGAAYLLNLKNGRSRLVADPLAETTKDVTFGEMEPWKFTASDGTVVDGWMCLPPDFDPAKKYPLIVYYYGGTSPSNASFYHLYSPQVFASRDYVVYVLNPSGTTGYGQEYSARHVNAWGKRTADEIIEGTKKFCAAHPFVNDKKIGCIGASYGGFMTQYLQTLTDIFAAAVSHAGISNVTSYWGEGYWGYSYNSVAAAKSYPWTDPELYTRQGSLFNADKIHTPLLLLHGTVDTNVPIGESIQLFNALKILGRDVEFITVQDENHVISGFYNKLAWQNTIMAWFARYLQDDPRWWESLYGK